MSLTASDKQFITGAIAAAEERLTGLISDVLTLVNERCDRLEQRVARLETRADSLDDGISRMALKLDNHTDMFNAHEWRLRTLEAKQII